MKRLYNLIILILLSGIISAQSLVEKVFDFNEIDRAYDIIQLDEGGYLILAATTDNGVGKSVFIRLDENGDTLWTKQRQYYGYSIVQFDSSTYYIAGHGFGSRALSHGVLNKLDSNFDRLWIKTYSSNNGDIRLSNLKKNQNNNLTAKYYYKADNEMVPPYESIDIFDSSGVYINDFIYCMYIADYEQLSNTDYVVATKYDYGNYPEFVEIRGSSGSLNNKIDVSDIVFTQSSMVKNVDTAFIIGGNMNNKEIDRVAIYRKDPTYDDLSWIKHFSNLRGSIYSSCIGLENSILVLGNVDGIRSSAYIFNVSSTGDSISTSIIDKFPTIYPEKIISNEDSYFMIATIEYEDESRDIYFLKAALDTVLVNIEESTKIVDRNYFSLYPNPASSIVNIVFSKEIITGIQISVHNLNGKKVYEKKLINETESISINTENWKKGIYVVSLIGKKGYLQCEKILVQ